VGGGGAGAGAGAGRVGYRFVRRVTAAGAERKLVLPVQGYGISKIFTRNRKFI